MTQPFATLPEPPYYAVIFSSTRRDGDNGYGEMAIEMQNLAATMPGYLGIESARDINGFGITVSYWQSEQDIQNWRKNARHQIAQKFGQTEWYEHYQIRIAYVERAYQKP